MPNMKYPVGIQSFNQIGGDGYAVEYAADDKTVCQTGCNFRSKTGTVGGYKVNLMNIISNAVAD